MKPLHSDLYSLHSQWNMQHDFKDVPHYVRTSLEAPQCLDIRSGNFRVYKKFRERGLENVVW